MFKVSWHTFLYSVPTREATCKTSSVKWLLRHPVCCIYQLLDGCMSCILTSVSMLISASFLIFIDPCIVIYSYSTTTNMHLFSQFICSCRTLYMLRTAFPSTIRSSKLRIQQRCMSNSCCYLLLSGMRCKFQLIPDSSRYQQLFDIYHCCIRSFELLTMDGKTVRNM